MLLQSVLLGRTPCQMPTHISRIRLNFNSGRWRQLHQMLSNSMTKNCKPSDMLGWTCCVKQPVRKPVSFGFRFVSNRTHSSGCCKQKTLWIPTRGMVSKPYNMSGSVRHDTLVFSHKNDSFFKMLSYFGLFQLGMWSYLSMFAFQQLKAVPVGVQDTSGFPWYKRLMYKQGQYKNALSLLSFIVGGVVFFITATYPRRVVKSLWLLKGGEHVKVSTYSWMGKTRTFTKPVDHLSCTEARTGKGQQIPMKIKDSHFYYIIDKQGTFPKTDLFDFVIGVKRKL